VFRSHQTPQFLPTPSIHFTYFVSIRIVCTKYCTLTVNPSHATIPRVLVAQTAPCALPASFPPAGLLPHQPSTHAFLPSYCARNPIPLNRLRTLSVTTGVGVHSFTPRLDGLLALTRAFFFALSPFHSHSSKLFAPFKTSSPMFSILSELFAQTPGMGYRA
jgi:hypothetical protein